MCFTVRNLKDEVLSFKVSDNVVFTTSSSSLSPWAIRAVDAMVSWRDGWSSQDTLSGTSVSPKSSKEALAALLVLAGLILNVTLEEVTACLKVSYCAAEIFFPSPSASSSSENALLESMSNAALKLSGDSSRAADSTDEDLESGERDLESPDSLWFLDLLTGVLGGLTGVLACLSASLARLTRELIELCGVWRNLSGDLVLVGDPAGVADLVLSESRSGTGKDAWTVGLMELSGTLGSSMRRWSNVHIDIKSTSVAWLMVLGMEGKRSGVLVPVWMETSGPPTGVAAGFSCLADPSTPAAGRGGAPAEPSATGAGTGTAGADSIRICRAGEATTVIVRFSWVLDFGGDSWNSRLTTNVPPVLSALSSSLAVMARGRARRTGVQRLWDTAGLGTSTRARPTRGTWPVPLALSPVIVVAVTTWGLMPRRFAVSSFAIRRPRPAVARPVGAGPFRRRDVGSHGLGLRWTRDCLRPLGLRWLLGLGTLGRKSVPWCV